MIFPEAGSGSRGTEQTGPSSQMVTNQEGNWSILGPVPKIRGESNKLHKLQTGCKWWQTAAEPLHSGELIPASKAMWR